MPRGEETQEVPQEEGREIQENQETQLEAQRDQEVVSEPEAVVERERPVEESEAIEAAVVEALEAVQEDGIPKTEDQEQVQAGEEISATPIPLPGQPDKPADEISATPIPLPGQPDITDLERPIYEGEIKSEDQLTPKESDPEETDLPQVKIPTGTRVEEVPTPVGEEEPPTPPQREMGDGEQKSENEESTIGIEETSFKVESQAGVVEEVLNEVSPETQPEIGAEEAVRIGAEEIIMDETSFKVETPASETETSDVILDDTDFKFFTPQPEGELSESSIPQEDLEARVEAEVEDLILEEGSFKPVPAGEATEKEQIEQSAEETATEGQEEEGGSILIGEEGTEEIEQIDLTAEASKEVEEYWEPPEMYIHQNNDGSIEFVDANGKPISCPPHYSKDHETGEVYAWYPGAEGNTFKVASYQGPDPEQISTYTDKDGTVYFYDENNQPLLVPPDFMRDSDGSIMVKDAQGNYVTINTIDTEELFGPGNVMVYEYPDGSYDLITSEGIQSEWIPDVYRDSEGNYYTKDLQGNEVEIKKIEPTGSLYTSYIYQNSDGSYNIVDSQGKQVKYPPHVDKIVDSDGTVKYIAKTKDGEIVELETYQPLPDGLYAYTSQDGTVYLVDKNGNQVESPPHLDIEHSPTGPKFYTPDGTPSGVEILAYKAPIKDMYIHLNQDGSIDIVDQNGKMIESPPNITIDIDPSGKPIYMAKYAGMPIESSVNLSYYKPPSSH